MPSRAAHVAGRFPRLSLARGLALMTMFAGTFLAATEPAAMSGVAVKKPANDENAREPRPPDHSKKPELLAVPFDQKTTKKS
jgi:hypothetical protein